MKELPLLEKDVELFDSQLNRTLYTVYRDNIENFTVMWEQQGTGYWLRFCISLRSVMQEQGYSIHLASLDTSHFEDFFISLTRLLTGKSSEQIHLYIKDVVSVSRFHQFLNNIPDMFVSKEYQVTQSFKRLFGQPAEGENIVKIFVTLPLHLRAVGCLLQLLRRWPKASFQFSSKPWWCPPQSWHYGNQLKASHYEVFLKNNWKDNFFAMVNVRPGEVCWWNALPQRDRIAMIQERSSELGMFISNMCKELNRDFLTRIGVLESELVRYNFFSTCPRGIFCIICSKATTLMFVVNMWRGFYLADSLTTFHPFSQIIIGFTNAAFSSGFWYGGKGMDNQLHKLRDKNIRSLFKSSSTETRSTINLMVNILGGHMMKCITAMKMNSQFYDSLFRSFHWTIPVNVQRFSWNMPLCINWLELVLIKIYELERHFIPICHFPLRNSVVPVVEVMYKKINEAKFLSKSCIMIVEVIIKKQNSEAGRCYEARKLVNTVIPTIAHYMNFLEENAYIALDGILKAGWNKGERDYGECCPLIKDRTKINYNNWDIVPDIENYFSENYRHINYWIESRIWPDIDAGKQYFTEVVEMLRDYKSDSYNTTSESSEPYNYSMFRKCALDKSLFDTDDCPSNVKLAFISHLLDLLAEDGWISSEPKENFWNLFGRLYDLDSIKQKLDKKDTDESDDGLSYILKLDNNALMYYVVAYLLGETWKNKIAGQNSLAQLHRSQCLVILADTGARLSAMIQSLNPKLVECPSTQYFKDAADKIETMIKKKHVSVADVEKSFKALDKQIATDKLLIATDIALHPVKVPFLEDMRKPKVGLTWLVYLEEKRQQLLQLVSNKQFEISSIVAKKICSTGVKLFPHYDVLEHRLVEEMAAMQKCLELGGFYYGSAYGLCRLLAHRFAWLQNEFISWRDSQPRCEELLPFLTTTLLRQFVIDMRIRLMAAWIPLEALFMTYISQYRTTHPITEASIDLLFEWADSARLWSLQDKGNEVGEVLTDYVKALESMGGAYVEQLLLHCKTVWVVSPFVMDPEGTVKIGSMEHAQQIVTMFQQLFLMSFHMLLSRNPRCTSWKLPDKVKQNLVQVRARLRQAELDDPTSTSWVLTRKVLKKELQDLWSDLIELRKMLSGNMPNKAFPRWYGNELPAWKEFLSIFVSVNYKNILEKIAYSAFMNTPDSDTNENAEKETKANKNKGGVSGPGAEVCAALDEAFEDIRLPAGDNPRKINKPNEESCERVTYELSFTQLQSGEGCMMMRREMVFNKQTPISEDSTVKKEPRKRNRKKRNKNSQDKPQEETTEQPGEIMPPTKPVPEKSEDENIKNKLKSCMNCKSVEPQRRTYKKCALCKTEGWLHPRFYCSQACQVKHWESVHKQEHKSGEALQH